LTVIHACTAGLAIFILAFTEVQASRLGPQACEDLRGRRDALVSLGVRGDMTSGPKWAADNLQSDRVDRIKSYVVSVEQVLFRCPSRSYDLEDGMDLSRNMPDPKPRFARNVFPLPARKPIRPPGLRQAID
jgi:hypothetical protein